MLILQVNFKDLICFKPRKQFQTHWNTLCQGSLMNSATIWLMWIANVLWIGGGHNHANSLLLPSWQKHILNFPTSQIEIVRIFPLLESSHHFAYVISKLKILKFQYFKQELTIRTTHWLLQNILIWQMHVKLNLVWQKKLEIGFDDGVECKGFSKVLCCHSFTSLPKVAKTCL